jgi:mevalonate kinase
MSGDHNTPIGTPVVLAPGKIFLVGEYAVLDEGRAVLAAISLHAKAQFIPRLGGMPPMVTELVRRTKVELGEAAAALPPGGVMANTDAFKLGCAAGGLGSSAAIAVATVGAVYESLGLAVEEHRPKILALADAGRRAVQGDVGSGADTVAATFGGLVQITRHQDALPSIDRLAPPAGLHGVLFSAGRSISTRQMTAGLRAYAQHEPAAFEHAMNNLREIAQRFVAEISAAHATGAVVAAGKYGDELAKLSSAASVPIVTEAFALASELARQFGGIAKPAGAGGGEIGVALFATPEAAGLFRKACSAPLAPLDGDIETSGVRCRNPKKAADDSAIAIECVSTPSPEPSEIAIRPILETGALIVRSIHDVETVRQQIDQVPPSQPIHLPRPHVWRRRLIPAAAIAVASVVTWFAFPWPVGAPDHGPPRPTNSSQGARSRLAVPEQADLHGDNPSPPQDAGEQAAANPAPESPPEPSRHVPAHTQGAGRSPEPKRHTRSAPGREPALGPVPKVPARMEKPSARRAGNLSPDDF